MRICPACDVKTDAEDCPDCGRRTVLEARLMAKRADDPFLGKIIEGKYEVEGRIGQGGMASVYKAKHTETGAHLAVKLIRVDRLEDDNHIRRFYIEAQNTHGLSHPNTIRVSDFGQTDDGILYMVMEYVQGKNLGQVIKEEGRVAPARVARIVLQVLKSLGEAHDHQVIHRDIKPDNVMLIDQFGEPDFVKVLDFGVSRSLDSSGASTKGAIGTPKYMAPEQWVGKSVDGRADLYSLGIMMYRMLAGTLPFAPDTSSTDSAIAFMNAHLKEPPTPLVHFTRDSVPAELVQFVMWLIRKDPDERPQDALTALQQLQQIIRNVDLSEELLEVPDITRPDEADDASVGATMMAPDGAVSGLTQTQVGAGMYQPSPGDPNDSSTSLDSGSGVTQAALDQASGGGIWKVWVGLAAVAVCAVAAFSVLGGESTDQQAVSGAEAVVAGDAPGSTKGEAVASKTAPKPEPRAPIPLKVTSKPPGAQVALAGGAVLGTTPLDTDSSVVPAGARLEIGLEDHRKGQTPALVYGSEGEAASVHVDLIPLPTLQVRSTPPGATARLKGTSVILGTTPFPWTLNEAQADALAAGAALHLNMELAGHKAHGTEVSQQQVEDSKVVATLTPILRKKAPVKKAAPKAKSKPKAPKSKDGWSF